MLNPIAGVPPKVPDLVATLHRTGSLDGQDFWRRQVDWIVDAEQTHTAFPILTYFPEADRNPSWVASIGVILDAAALIVSASEAQPSRVLADEERGPLMALVYGTAAIDRIARAASIPLPPAVGVVEITDRGTDEPPPISVTREEYHTVLAAVAPIIGFETRHEDEGWHRFAWIRSTYDQPLRALAGIARGAAGPVDDRSSGTRGPPALPAQAPTPGGLVGAGTAYRWLKPPDSSLVIDTETGWRSKWAIESFMSWSRSPARSRLTPWRTRMRWTEMLETDPVRG